MADRPSFAVPSHLRDFAETSLNQARQAFAGSIAAARRGNDTLYGLTELARTNAPDVFSHRLDYAEPNVRSALALARKLAAARSFREVKKIQAQAPDLNGLARHAFQVDAERARTTLQAGVDAARHAVQEIRQASEQLSR